MMDVCKCCGVLTHIQNKFHTLCDDCVYKKNHHGKNKTDVAKERHEKRHKDHSAKTKVGSGADKGELVEMLKKKFSIKQVSNKKAERDRAMKKTYHKIDTTRDPVCEGCNRGGEVALSHSHILSQANRPDLAAEGDNIRLHCFGTYHSCHEKWERGIPFEIVDMDDFKENLAYIEMMDKERYRKIIVNIEVAGVKI